MSSDPKIANRYGVRFTATNSDEEDKKDTKESPGLGDACPRGRAFANFFEEFEKESDGMSQTFQGNEFWQQSMRYSFDNDGTHRSGDPSSFYNQHNLEDSYLHDADPDLVYMDRYGGLSHSFLPQSFYSDVCHFL